MNILHNRHYAVVLDQPEGIGTAWVVRVYKKGLLFKKVISSDWFLDEHQARLFAESLAKALQNGADINALKNRKPGWTLPDTRHHP
jgi:beta-glucosidase-like glycosyl hydrolase